MKHSRNLSIGPGGRRCICCFPAPRSKDRRFQYRSAKRKDIKDAMKVEEININGENNELVCGTKAILDY